MKATEIQKDLLHHSFLGKDDASENQVRHCPEKCTYDVIKRIFSIVYAVLLLNIVDILIEGKHGACKLATVRKD